MPGIISKISFDDSCKGIHNNEFRNEVKYILMPLEYMKFLDLCAGFMTLDENTGINGTYIVKSYYFDTLSFTDFEEKQNGIHTRQKYRIRTYGGTSFYKLEVKEKRGNLNRKLSGAITLETADALIHGDMRLRTGDEITDAIIEKMQLRGYKYSISIKYERQAYVIKELDLRITFDREIEMLFGKYRLNEVMPDFIPVLYNNETIMEVKYKEQLPKWLQNSLCRITPGEMSLGKYTHSLKNFLL